MRKKYVLALIIAVISLPVALSACSSCDNNGKHEGNVIIEVSDTNRYDVVPVAGEYELADWYSNGIEDIYIFNLGTVNNVPVDVLEIVEHKASRTEIEYSTSETMENSITEIREKFISNSLEYGLSTTLGISIPAMKFLELGASATASTKTSSIKTITETVESYINFSSTHTTSVKLTLGNKNARGWYRAAIFSSFDIYAVYVIDKETGEKSVNYTVYSQENFSIGLDYSEDNQFSKEDIFAKIALPDEAKENLPVATIPNWLHFEDLTDKATETLIELTISPETKQVVILGDDREFLMEIVISARETNLGITLANAKIVASLGKTALDHDGKDASTPHTVMFSLRGENYIKGGNGADGVEHDKDVNVRHAKGGAPAIDIGSKHSLEFVGSGDISLFGGDGGHGTNGEYDEANFPEDFSRRTGGNGGSGGCGIICKIVSLLDATGNISVRGGLGGNGGNGGNTTAWNMGYVPGGNGGNAGDGGYAIVATELPIQGKLTARAYSAEAGIAGRAGYNRAVFWGIPRHHYGKPGKEGKSVGADKWFDLDEQFSDPEKSMNEE